MCSDCSMSTTDAGLTDGQRVNTYVRLTGSVRVYDIRKSIDLAHVRPSFNPHELYFHLGEAMCANHALHKQSVSMPRLLSFRELTDGAYAEWRNAYGKSPEVWVLPRS